MKTALLLVTVLSIAYSIEASLPNDETNIEPYSGVYELWEQLMADLHNSIDSARTAECRSLMNADGGWASPEETVYCSGKLQVIGFPCMRCRHAFNWRNAAQVRACAANQECVLSGFDAEVLSFNNELNYLGQVPMLTQGAIYVNTVNNTEDKVEFVYNQKESSGFSWNMKAGVNIGFGYSASFTVPSVEGSPGGGTSNSFSMGISFSASRSESTSTSRSWTAIESIKIPGLSRMSVTCSIIANHFNGDYNMKLIPKGKVMYVFWNEDYKGKGVEYVHVLPGDEESNIQYWMPNGYEYEGVLEGMQGVDVDCNKRIEAL